MTFDLISTAFVKDKVLLNVSVNQLKLNGKHFHSIACCNSILLQEITVALNRQICDLSHASCFCLFALTTSCGTRLLLAFLQQNWLEMLHVWQ